jgi:hypothetical protein
MVILGSFDLPRFTSEIQREIIPSMRNLFTVLLQIMCVIVIPPH